MDLWTAETGGFWWRAILSLVLLLLVGEVCHVHIVPARYYWTDAFILAPLALCWVLGVRAGPGIDYVTRGVYGMFQAMVLIFVYSNYWGRALRLGDPFSAFWNWVGVTIVYSMLFTGLTQSIVVARQELATANRLECEQCGYSLRGLEDPRCPECGTPFDPALLAQSRPCNGAGPGERDS